MPFIYRSIQVHRGLLAHLDDNDSIYLQTIRDKIKNYTEEIIVGTAIEANLLVRLIPSIEKLKYLRSALSGALCSIGLTSPADLNADGDIGMRPFPSNYWKN